MSQMSKPTGTDTGRSYPVSFVSVLRFPTASGLLNWVNLCRKSIMVRFPI